MGDYVSDISLTLKLKMIAPVGASWCMGETIYIICSCPFLVTPNFAHVPMLRYRKDFEAV